MPTFNFYIAKQYSIEDWPDFDSAKNQFINDIANGNFDIENDDEGKAKQCLSGTQQKQTDFYSMKAHPVYYIDINNAEFYDFICDTLGTVVVVDAQGHLVLDCDSFHDELTNCIEQGGTESGKFTETDLILLEHLRNIDNVLQIENFKGDIWFCF